MLPVCRQQQCSLFVLHQNMSSKVGWTFTIDARIGLLSSTALHLKFNLGHYNVNNENRKQEHTPICKALSCDFVFNGIYENIKRQKKIKGTHRNQADCRFLWIYIKIEYA